MIVGRTLKANKNPNPGQVPLFGKFGFIIIAIPYTILYTGFGVSGVPLTIIIIWPGLYLIMYVIRKIKVGKHYSERNKKIKRMIKRHSKNADYIDELERLSSLKEKGIITEEEFQAKKKELL